MAVKSPTRPAAKRAPKSEAVHPTTQIVSKTTRVRRTATPKNPCVRISESIYRQLLSLSGELTRRTGRRVYLSEIAENAINQYCSGEVDVSEYGDDTPMVNSAA